jgi:hypothetical protein
MVARMMTSVTPQWHQASVARPTGTDRSPAADGGAGPRSAHGEPVDHAEAVVKGGVRRPTGIS